MSELTKDMNGRPLPYDISKKENNDNFFFISYSNSENDRFIVYQDLNELSNNGARYWYDVNLEKSDDWISVVERVINDPRCVGTIFYLSETFLKSEAFITELNLVLDRCKRDASYKYSSVNIGKKSCFELLKKTDLPEQKFVSILDSFKDSRLYIPRDYQPTDKSHLWDLINLFSKNTAINESLNKYKVDKEFTTEVNADGTCTITKYCGKNNKVINIPEQVEGHKVAKIGLGAFAGNQLIEVVNIPEGVTHIEKFAFKGCCHLKDVNLPNSLSSLGYETFRDCDSITSISIPANVYEISAYTFYRCHNLREIILNSTCDLYIGDNVFSECYSLKDFILPKKTRTIGCYCFNECTSLINLTIPASVENIGTSAFHSCLALKEVRICCKKSIPNDKMFSRCHKLEHVIFDASKKDYYLNDESWEEYKKYICFVLDTPANVVYLGNGKFDWDRVPNAELFYININDKEYQSGISSFILPNISSYKKVNISIKSHSSSKYITDSEYSTPIVISSDDSDFEFSDEKHTIISKYVGKASYVVIPDGVTEIGNYAFYNLQYILEVQFPTSLKVIGDYTFKYCSNIKKLELHEGIESIGIDAFYGIDIVTLTVPASLKYIGARAFAFCPKLVSANLLCNHLDPLPHDKDGGDRMFYRCEVLKDVNLGPIDTILKGMFRGCLELATLYIPSTVKKIEDKAISYIMRMENVCVPESVKEIGFEAFAKSFNLKNINIEENDRYKSVNGVLFEKGENEELILCYPSNKDDQEYRVNADAICDSAFMDAYHLEKLVIGNKCKSIGSSAFEHCSNLKTLVCDTDIVRSIGKNAFKDCIELEKIVFKSLPPQLDDDVFSNVNLSKVKVYCSKKYYEKFKITYGWKKYISLLVELDDEELKGELL